MQVALIPPTEGIEHYAPKGSMDLILPHMWQPLGPYRQAYKRLWNDNPNRYVILDNGAAEGQMLPSKEMLNVIDSVAPDEFALPDVMGDVSATLRLAEEWKPILDKPWDHPFKIGYVAQGKSRQEVLDGVQEFLTMYRSDARVVYLPRILMRLMYATARLDLAREIHALDLARDIHRLDAGLEIHLFGMSPAWPQEINYASLSSYIRSVDTSLPFYYAQAGIRLTGHTERQTSRSDDYFEFSTSKKRRLTDRNVRAVLKWAAAS